jgi:hypothetical protein
MAKSNAVAVNQKGANGIVAEYQCAATLNEKLERFGMTTISNQASLKKLVSEALSRVANELTREQQERALRQGIALGDYLFTCLTSSPSDLGLSPDLQLEKFRIEVRPIGSNTNSGDPADLIVTLDGNQSHSLSISLKAYRGPQSSLGSKSGRASLGRLFMQSDKVSSKEFVERFGSPALEYENQIRLFKSTAKEFYASEASRDFLDAYEARKGTRKVNNPLRRKEVGDYFTRRFGFVSEHKLANLYVECYQIGKAQLEPGAKAQEAFVRSLRFILGNPELLVLDAKDGSGVIEIVNSLKNPIYSSLNRVLRPGLEMTLISKADSSIIGVNLRRNDEVLERLSLAMWKDGTIQFKLDTSGES